VARSTTAENSGSSLASARASQARNRREQAALEQVAEQALRLGPVAMA
jgi:hypothetical protein